MLCDREAHSPTPQANNCRRIKSTVDIPSINPSIDQTKGPFLSDPPTSPHNKQPPRYPIQTIWIIHFNRVSRHHPTPAHPIPPDRLRGKSKEWNEVVDLKPRADFSGQTRRGKRRSRRHSSPSVRARPSPPFTPSQTRRSVSSSSFKGEESVSVLITRSAESP